ncbi:hypothetical protein Hanom_Chr14g01272451 [Helianthus anomalus]
MISLSVPHSFNCVLRNNVYCKRAKGVFNELNAKPYVLELDERGEWFWILLFALLVIALVLNNFLI